MESQISISVILEEKMPETKEIKVEQKVVDRLLKKIILLEKRNLKTSEYNYVQIVKKIKKMIQEEVECY